MLIITARFIRITRFSTATTATTPTAAGGIQRRDLRPVAVRIGVAGVVIGARHIDASRRTDRSDKERDAAIVVVYFAARQGALPVAVRDACNAGFGNTPAAPYPVAGNGRTLDRPKRQPTVHRDGDGACPTLAQARGLIQIEGRNVNPLGLHVVGDVYEFGDEAIANITLGAVVRNVVDSAIRVEGARRRWEVVCTGPSGNIDRARRVDIYAVDR